MTRNHVVGECMYLPIQMEGTPYIALGKCLSINDRFARYEFQLEGGVVRESYCLHGPILTGREYEKIKRFNEDESVRQAADRVMKNEYKKK